jgi:hypothetical protein
LEASINSGAVHQVDAIIHDHTTDIGCGLSPREVEVLRLIAAGKPTGQ